VNIDPIIDPNTISELKATVGSEFIGELIDTYLEETPRLIEELVPLLEKLDTVAFGRTAHSIKSSSASLGALSFAAQAKELELMGKAGDLTGAEVKVEQLKVDYGQVKRALKELKDGS
jgi:HPt (histidine-containing phosphotransfer) domain-containing protein